ncbi:MAG: deoxyribonuclease IV [Candidatus Bathyarchaeia archaeon]|nr:deoxyribonuclease IV [Candidatus Bathyarchaeota archaeon]
MVRCGVHVSIGGSIDRAVDRAKEKGCDTFQIFTRNPRSWSFRKLFPLEVKRFKDKLRMSSIEPAVAHMPYLPNLSCPKNSVYKRSVSALITELKRCSILEIPYLVTHLGSHLGKGREVGLEHITGAINASFDSFKDNTMLLLENSAGGKNTIGSSFTEIREIIDNVDEKDRVAVCFDTCHAFAAGYDLRTNKDVERVVEEIDEVIGWDLLKVIHMNDSKGVLGSSVDRHEHIGIGHIGEDGFRAILHNEFFRELPIILETPIDERGDDILNLQKIRRISMETQVC